MIIQHIVEISIWNDFFNKYGSPSFLQSWEWGNVQEKMGHNILRLGIYEKNKLKALAQIIKIKARRGNFLFIPHGPIFTKHETCSIRSIIAQLLNYLITLSQKENFSFIRLAPILKNIPENQRIFVNLGFRTAPIYMHAETVWMLPLTGAADDEELLSGMRKTTRYSIRKAQRDGVVIEKRTDEKAVDDFYKIYEETAKRESFVPFSKDFIKCEFEAFQKTGNALFLYNPLAAALILFTKSTALYHQGASIHTKIPVTYLLQWEAIREAKKRGCQFYNFWGIHHPGRTPKSWAGLTLFKTGFGGKQIDYVPTQDYVTSPKYYLTYLYEKLLAWRRGV